MNTHRAQPPLDRTWFIGRGIWLVVAGLVVATLVATAAVSAGRASLPMDDGVPATVTTLPATPEGG